MKDNIAAITGKIVAMFAMLATTGASLPGSDIRPPVRFMRDAKDEPVCSEVNRKPNCLW
jgi:hypothetical protein